MSSAIPLSSIAPDFAEIFAQLVAQQQASGAWLDILDTSTGTTLLTAMAGVGALDQYAIESAVQEAFLRTAKKDSSIYANVIGQGVRISRWAPAAASVSFTFNNTYGTPITLPAYTQFSGNQVNLFNRTSITFATGTSTQTVILYEGLITTENYQGSGNDYQVYISNNGGFVISNVDVQVAINSVNNLGIITDGLWNYPNPGLNIASTNAVAQDTTNEQGCLVLVFGGGGYGYVPILTDTITLTYVVTLGAGANNLTFNGTTLVTTALVGLTGTAVSNLTNGTYQPPSAQYRLLGPQLFSANNREVTPTDYQANAIAYTGYGILDCIVIPQRNYAPTLLQYSCVARVCALTATSMNNTQWNNFVAYISQKSMLEMNFLRYDPIAVPVTITANIYCNTTVDLVLTQATILENLTTLVAPQMGLLQATLALSDIYQLIQSTPGVIYADILAPTKDIYTAININLFNFSLAGTSPSGTTLQYYLTATTAAGESLGTYNSILTPSSGGVTMTWANVFPNLITGFKIYKWNPANSQFEFLASVSATTFTYTDNLATATSYPPSVPTIDNSGIYYVTLGTVTLNMNYASPNLFNTSLSAGL